MRSTQEIRKDLDKLHKEYLNSDVKTLSAAHTIEDIENMMNNLVDVINYDTEIPYKYRELLYSVYELLDNVLIDLY